MPILEDILLEGNELFGGLLSVIGVDGVMAGPDNMANVTILDNEGDIIVEFEKSAYSFNEDVGDGILTLVAIAPAPAGGYSVDVSFADGTAGCKQKLVYQIYLVKYIVPALNTHLHCTPQVGGVNSTVKCDETYTIL